jgi:FMN phosphatase YigB (HAD superfamily)
LLAITEGELLFEHPNDFVMDIALSKTIDEFKMWTAMSRKPGRPSEHLKEVYSKLLIEQRTRPAGGEKYPEIRADSLWESVVKKLLQKDYRIDTSSFGSLNEFSRKVAYFFHASLQGSACYAGAAESLRRIRKLGIRQGLIADAQSFTSLQLERGLQQQSAGLTLDDLMDPDLVAYSCELRARKPSERIFRPVLSALARRGILPGQALHVGARINRDLAPARRLGMRTALFAGDKGSLQLNDVPVNELPTRVDAVLTRLDQIADVVG